MRFVFTLFAFALSVPVADAGPLRGRRAQPVYQQTTCSQSATTTSTCGPNGCTFSSTKTQEFSQTTTTGTALDEVNAKRVSRGLRPYIFDPLLTEAAERCAEFRARHRLFGHTNNDFQFLRGTKWSRGDSLAVQDGRTGTVHPRQSRKQDRDDPSRDGGSLSNLQGEVMLRVLNVVLFVLFLPFWPLFWVMCRLQAKPCPACGEKWLTELVGEWDGEQWRCARCNHYWEVK